MKICVVLVVLIVTKNILGLFFICLFVFKFL